MCDAETQQSVGVCMRWTAERQDKTDKFVSLCKNLYLTTQLIYNNSLFHKLINYISFLLV